MFIPYTNTIYFINNKYSRWFETHEENKARKTKKQLCVKYTPTGAVIAKP
jgi:hypothetical protein